MRVDAINTPNLVPTPPTEAGAPLAASERLPFSSVMPSPILPEEGSRTDDRHSRNDQPRTEQEEEYQEELPEVFQLIIGPDFATFLRFLSVEAHDRIFKITKEIQRLRKITRNFLYPEYFVKTDPMKVSITESYTSVNFYHETRPGKRFKGAM